MKNLLYLFSATLFALTSCSKDDNATTSNNSIPNLIIGKWVYTQLIKNGVTYDVNPIVNGCPRGHIEYKMDNTYVKVDYTNNAGTCNQNVAPAGNYIVEGNIITYPPLNANFKILELTNDKIKILSIATGEVTVSLKIQ